MERQATRRTVLGTTVAGAAAVVLGVRGVGMEAGASNDGRIGASEGTPVAADSRTEDGRMVTQTSKDLWQPWSALWNGDLEIADRIIAPDFIAHFAPADSSPGEVRGPEGLKGWISGAMVAFENPRFETAVGPLAEGDRVAGRWLFRATYKGGMPGASAEAVGQPVEYAGHDIFRVEAGQIVEYWLCADIVQLLQQVGVIPS